MKTQNKTDAYEKIRRFQQGALSNKPSIQEMIHDVQRMNFKIKPVAGNISSLDFNNEELIDTLWCLGKLDEFCRQELQHIPAKEHEIFFRLINELRFNFQEKLNKVKLVIGEPADEAPFFEAEIYKDSSQLIH